MKKPGITITRDFQCILSLLLLAILLLSAQDALAATVDYLWFDQSAAGIGEYMKMLRKNHYAGLFSAYPFFTRVLAIHYGYLFWPFVLVAALGLQSWSDKHFPDSSVRPQNAFYWFTLVNTCCITIAATPFAIGLISSRDTIIWVTSAAAILAISIYVYDPKEKEPPFLIFGIGLASILVLLAQPFLFAMIVAVALTAFMGALLCAVLFLFLIALPPFNNAWLKARANARHFYCPKCLRRNTVLDGNLSPLVRWSGRIIFRENSQKHEQFEDYYICGCCSSGKLLKNVRTMIGVIGTGSANIQQQGNRAYLRVWSEQEKKAINADIDLLEIRRHFSISYGYAINSFLNCLKNDLGSKRILLKKIPVAITGNLTIPEESLRLLRKNFKTIRKY